MARVFVSHASEDRALAGELHGWLDNEGHDVFLAEDLRNGIAVGEEWQQRLHERLRWADAVVCVITSAYLASRWCTAEAAISWSRGSRLLPLRAEPGVADPLLTSVQHTDYTRDPNAARTALDEALRRVDAAGGWGWPDDRSPFPGLRPFDVDRHRVFFGRTDESGELAELLRSPAERTKGAALLVAGPSGCGKSSLVRAGLLPVMADEPGWWTLAPIVPGADPVAALVRELANAARRLDLGWTVAYIRDQLDEDGLAALVDELLLAAPRGSRRLLVVVDQFEELLTQAAPPDRARFAELLRPALAGPVQLVITLRSEFLDQLLLEDEPAALPTRTYTLRPLGREALRAVIERPARLVGIDVDDDLVDRLVDDTGSGDALPLLAFTLAQLAEGIGRGGRLSSERYGQLGGVQGALTRQAEQALVEAVAAGGRSREEVISGLLGLVTVDEEGRRTRRRVLREELPHPVADEVDAFVARRLLTTDTDNGSGVIAVAHEAFLTAWSPLAQAITAAAAALRARHAVEQAAAAWDEEGRPSARLWTGGQLAAAVADTGARVQTHRRSNAATSGQRQDLSRWSPRRHRVLITYRVADLHEEARDFLYVSIRRDRFRRGRLTIILSVLLVLALTAASIAIFQQRAAQEQQRIATARHLVAQAEALRDINPRTALRLGIAAQRIYPDGETQASLVNTLTTTRYAGALSGHNGPVSAVAFSPHGPTLATGSNDGSVVLWDLTDPAQPRRLGSALAGHNSAVSAVAFSPHGPTLATGSNDGSVVLWDLTDPAQPRRLGSALAGHNSAVSAVAFSPHGPTLVTGIDDGKGNSSVVLWDLTDPSQPRHLGLALIDPSTSYRSVSTLVFSPHRATLAIGDGGPTVILWDLTDPAQPRRLGEPLTNDIGGYRWPHSAVAFSPNGHVLATGSLDGSVVLWDLTDPAQPRRLGQPLTDDTRMASSMAFSPNGHVLATGTLDGSVVLWDLTDPSQPRRLGTPLTNLLDGPLSDVTFSPNGSALATMSSGGAVVLWDLTDPSQPRRLGTPLTDKYVSSVAFSPIGAP
ncbi:MAG: TIR domain-containing protein [Actinomycetota bacterium]|nr:TIR domain-containing protein [Actinomycetota bacterium]